MARLCLEVEKDVRIGFGRATRGPASWWLGEKKGLRPREEDEMGGRNVIVGVGEERL